MSNQREQDPKRFSPEFEAAIQRSERIAARRNPPPRKRVRSKPCQVADCERPVHRNNTFSICLNHMMLIWQHVEGSSIPLYEMRDAQELFPTSAPISKPLTDEEETMRAMAKRQRERQLATKPGHLYVLDTQSGLLKIGWTSRLDQRIAQYPPTFTVIATAPGTRTDERDVHRSLRLARAMGREWYYVTPEVVRQINLMISTTNTLRAQEHSNRRNHSSSPEEWHDIALTPAFSAGMSHITEPPKKPAPIKPTRTSARRVG